MSTITHLLMKIVLGPLSRTSQIFDIRSRAAFSLLINLAIENMFIDGSGFCNSHFYTAVVAISRKKSSTHSSESEQIFCLLEMESHSFFSVLLQILIDLSATCILYIVVYTANIYRDSTESHKTRNCHWES